MGRIWLGQISDRNAVLESTIYVDTGTCDRDDTTVHISVICLCLLSHSIQLGEVCSACYSRHKQ